MTCTLLEGMLRIEGRILKGRGGERSRPQPCIDLCGDHDHNRVSKRDGDTLLLSPRGTG